MRPSRSHARVADPADAKAQHQPCLCVQDPASLPKRRQPAHQTAQFWACSREVPSMHKWPFATHPATVPSPIPFHVCTIFLHPAYVHASFCTSSTPRTGRTSLWSPSGSPIAWSTIYSIRLCPKDQLMTCRSQHADTRGVTASCHLQAAPTSGFHASTPFLAASSHLC